ncbi:MAG: anti-sigma factor [Solirubrobacterales bacterium]
MAVHDDDRAAYLAGEDREALTAGERAELDELRGLLTSEATWAEPDASLEDRVVAAIAAEARTAPAARSERPRTVRRTWRWSVGRPAYGLGVVAAAASAIAIVLASIGGSITTRQLAMAVSGTSLAPDAKGSGTLTQTESGWRIQLEATGLPRVSGGRYYEAWLKSPAGVLVAVGTFDDARHVTLWAGVAPPEYPTFTVTLQRAGAGAASSGERVLTGAVRITR